jgi:hypothetical protein
MEKSPFYTYNSLEWIGTSAEVLPPLNDNWQVRRELAAALRRLNSAALTSVAPTEQLQSVAALVNAEAARIEANERLFSHTRQSERLVTEQGQLPEMAFEMSPALGLSNAVAPPMHMWHAQGRIHGLVKPDWGYEGPSNHLHGGIIALLFDQLLGIGQRIAGSGGPTGTLTIRYHRPTPLNKTLRLVADVDRVEGRKKFMVGELWADDVRTVSCEGIFISAKSEV